MVHKKNLLRLFVAIDMPNEVKREIARIQEELKKLDLFHGTYVDPQVAHVTLHFLGYVEPIMLGPIKKLLESVFFKPIQTSLGELSSFQDEDFIKVIWLQLMGRGVIDLATDIGKVLSMGAPNEKRPFRPHVTIARVKAVKGPFLLRQTLKTLSVEPIAFSINEFVLKQSSLTGDGPVYTTLASFSS